MQSAGISAAAGTNEKNSPFSFPVLPASVSPTVHGPRRPEQLEGVEKHIDHGDELA